GCFDWDGNGNTLLLSPSVNRRVCRGTCGRCGAAATGGGGASASEVDKERSNARAVAAAAPVKLLA
ncbi:MAG TPA: hypothetical protein VL285_01465, partial [Bryobacteraceae bacterium]|nr:hypothetical protein [Bryobacteraceae bacterium]